MGIFVMRAQIVFDLRMFVITLVLILACCSSSGFGRGNEKIDHLPFPGALPLIGHGHQLFGNRKHLWKYMRQLCFYSLEKGGVLEMWLGPHSVYILTDPDDILTVSNTCLNKSYFYEFTKDYVQNGLITSEASIWKNHRKLLNMAFSQRIIDTFIDEMNTQTRELVTNLYSQVDKGPFDMRRYLIKFTLKTVSRTSLGLDAEDQAVIDETYVHAFESLLQVYLERIQKVYLHLSWIYDRTQLKKKQDHLTNMLINIMDSVIAKRKSERKNKKREFIEYDAVKPGKFSCLLEHLLQLAEDHNMLSDEEIRQHLDSFVMAAYDTTTGTLMHVFLAIGSYPEVQKKILAEVQQIQPNNNENISKYDLAKLQYVEAVIKETLRVYAPLPGIARKIEKDVKLKNYTLRAGSTCVMKFYGVSYHSMWGPDRNEFKPERWLDPAKLPANPNAFCYFGVGKRNCIGKQFAMALMKIVIAYVVRNYHLESDISKLESEYEVVLKPISGDLLSLTSRS
uniref:Cytochrome p450 CYP340AB1 n=1 Tax=Spodoptera exigua TaxID=7107 RepID=A0A248QEI2_SPOEX|nr:cytochrome p450 CYP340AB1 [Spodoptera exigua]